MFQVNRTKSKIINMVCKPNFLIQPIKQIPKQIVKLVPSNPGNRCCCFMKVASLEISEARRLYSNKSNGLSRLAITQTHFPQNQKQRRFNTVACSQVWKLQEQRKFYSNFNQAEIEISPQVLKKELERGDNLYLIDVREPSELEAFGAMPTAQNIPVQELESALIMSPETFMKKYGYEKPPDDGEDVVFLCQVGIRSLHATLKARQLGYERARSLAGGWSAWQEENE